MYLHAHAKQPDELQGSPAEVEAAAAAEVAASPAAAKAAHGFPLLSSVSCLLYLQVEFDSVANNGEILNYAISEHVENAGPTRV